MDNGDTNDPVKTGEIRDEQGRFPPGVSGNPNGRPQGSGLSITTEIKKKLAEIPEGNQSSYLQLLINKIIKQAIVDGDQQMITRIWNYVDGMPKQTSNMDVTSGGKPLPTPIYGGKSTEVSDS